MTLRWRLVLTIAGIALLLVVPSAVAVSHLYNLRDLAADQRTTHGAAYIALGALQSSLSKLGSAATDYNIDPIEPHRQAMLGKLDSARIHIRELSAAGYEESASRLEEVTDRAAIEMRRVELLTMDGRLNEGTTQLDTLDARLALADSLIALTFNEIDRNSTRDLERASSLSTSAATTAFSALLVCVALAVILGAWTTRALTKPIVRLRNAMAVVADGNFTVPDELELTRRDEIGSATRSFRAMTLRLADLERLKAEFMSFATHELRTPLNVVAGYADLLKDGTYGEMPASQIEAIDTIRDQTRVIAQLVSQLLDISRLEAGGLRIQVSDVRSADLFRRVERAFEPLARQKGVAFSVAVDETVPEVVPIDAERLADQVLGNLLSNALKFTPEGGQIRVTAHGTDDELTIEVSDTGPGIPADKLPMIFQKYYQVDDEARRKGAGLGLSIARDVVRAHGGTIHAESEPGVGTTFRVMLPLRTAASKHDSLIVEPA